MGLSPMPVFRPRGWHYFFAMLIWAIILTGIWVAVSHARDWPGAWIPYTSRPQIEAQWAELQRILHTSDDKLTPTERKWKREWTRGN